MPIEQFVTDKARLARILKHAKLPLKDAAAVNATRYAIGEAIKAFGLPTSFWTGGRTKFNRSQQSYKKDHFIDAACVGESGAKVAIPATTKPLLIKATGGGTHETVRTDKYGFPRNAAGRCKRVFGFQTGDLVRLEQPKGKYAGTHVGRLAGIRADGRLDIATLAVAVYGQEYVTTESLANLAMPIYNTMIEHDLCNGFAGALLKKAASTPQRIKYAVSNCHNL